MIPKSTFLSTALFCLAAAAGAAPCGPSFSAIHDYQPGDVFQYRSEGSSTLATLMKWETSRKVRVLSRRDDAGTRTYQVHTRMRHDDFYRSGQRSRSFSEKDTTLIYVDSAKHSLNACAGDLVPIPTPGFGYTRVEASEGDTAWYALAASGLGMKRIGSLVVYPPGTPVIADGPQAIQTYADGLGMVRRTESGYMSYFLNESMTGYTRAAKTRGEVLTDAEMTQPLALKPAAASGVRAVLAVAGPTGEGMDLRGRSVKQPRGWNIQVTP